MAKFSGFRTFKLGGTVEEAIAYLSNGLSVSLRELQAGLANLTFADNFKGQIIEVSIPAGQTVGFSHNLGVVPTQRVILKSTGSIDDSATPWTDTAVYFRNSGAAALTAKILLMR
jgi:hypothetical protein